VMRFIRRLEKVKYSYTYKDECSGAIRKQKLN
jgi:hypothetical protein